MSWLTINAGSSSIKYKIYRGSKNDLVEHSSGIIEGIGETSGNWRHNSKQESRTFKNHKEAFQALSERIIPELKNDLPRGVGHRVVHGGSIYFKPTIIDINVLQTIHDLARLAPLHNPANAIGIECAMATFPEAQHVAVFDTAFHAKMPDTAAYYPLHWETAQKEDIRRYGFHGINHAYVTEKAAEWLDKPFHECQFISLHLGNGASACLVKNGQSCDTSMGMTPLAGLMMGTRCGDIDPAIALYLINQGYAPEKVDEIFNKKSGLYGIANDNDMRRLLERVENNDKQAILAIDMYCYILQKTIGAYLSQCDALDALIFTGGVGENAAPIRMKTLATLKHFGFAINNEMNNLSSFEKNIAPINKNGIPILVIKGNEELAIAKACANVLQSVENPV